MFFLTVKRIPADQTVFDKEGIRIAMESKYIAGVQNGRKVRVWMTPCALRCMKGEANDEL